MKHNIYGRKSLIYKDLSKSDESVNSSGLAMNEQRNWKELNLADIEKQLRDPDLVKSACGCKMPIHTFRVPGDYLEGRLRPCPNRDRDDRGKAAHLYFMNEQGQEIGVAIRLSKMLWKTINKYHLWGCYIRVTFKGSVKTGFGHAKKLYLVEKDTGTLTENFEIVPAVNKRSKKPRSCRTGSGVKT